MRERREHTRSRVIYGGVVAFNNHCSTMDCIVRDFSSNGAKIEIAGHVPIPDYISLAIARKGREFAARVAWRTEHTAGLEFVSASIIPFTRART
jgi:PilZ domain